MAYTPPDGDSVNFSFTGGYSAPTGDAVHFLFGIVAGITVNSISRTTVSDANGFNTTIVNWQSSVAGTYSFEIGGTGRSTGGVVETGNIIAGYPIDTEISFTDVTTWSGYTGETSYRLNIYVLSADDIWTPYNYTV